MLEEAMSLYHYRKDQFEQLNNDMMTLKLIEHRNILPGLDEAKSALRRKINALFD